MKKYLFAPVSFLLLIGAGCHPSAPYVTPSSGPTLPQAAAPTSSPSSQESVSISGFSFQPAIITVKAGTTVVWTNNDPMSHTVTADGNAFDSGTIASGGTYSRTFTQAGSYSYHCGIHPSMQATIVVQ